MPDSTLEPAAFWRLSLTTAGGFTGGGNGQEVWSDGSVFSTQRVTAGADPIREYQGQKSADEVDKLVQLLDDAKDVSFKQNGNMTTSVVWETPKARHLWVWAAFDNEMIPEPLKAIKTELSAAGDLASGTPPSFELGGQKSSKGSIDLFLTQGQPYELTVNVGKSSFEGSGTEAIQSLAELAGKTVPIDDGKITITSVDGGWVNAEITQKSETGHFRLPAWVSGTP